MLRGRAVLSRAASGPALHELHQALRAWVVRNPGDAAAWEMLAACEAAKGSQLAMLRATAEAHLAAGKADAAIVTLQTARSQAARSRDADGVELAIIDSRLAELRRQRAQQRSAGGRGQPGDRPD
jgi:predicted Zn-dependent protease